LRWLIRIVGLVVLLAIAGAIASRLHDGPLIPFLPGGALRSGDWYELPVSDWSFAEDVAQIELQLDAQSISRITWILVRDGVAFVPASLSFPPGKTWHETAQRDGRAVLRINGQRYAVTLTRDDAPTIADFGRAEVERKYGFLPPHGAGFLFFRVTSRAREGA
jgi:hypothetical protein